MVALNVSEATQSAQKMNMRERLLTLAEEAALEKSFANISLDELAAAAGISKSGLLYHFKSKDELGVALVQRCTEGKMLALQEVFQRAQELHDDPLHVFLIALKLFGEMVENSDSYFSKGFLVNAYTFQDRHHIKDIREVSVGHLMYARERIVARLNEIAEKYPIREGADIEALADMVQSIVEGGMVISAMVGDRTYLSRQLETYRKLVRNSFVVD